MIKCSTDVFTAMYTNIYVTFSYFIACFDFEIVKIKVTC